MTISGNVCVRNGNSLDYCWRQAVASLLPVCNEVVISDGQSNDGTQEEIREWIKLEPKIKLCVYPWPDPRGDNDFWVNWLNTCRDHIKTDYQIQLDADEVLHENSYPAIERIKKMSGQFSVKFHRLNFWRDAQHLIPHGVCCGHEVIRIAPQNVWLPSDGCHPNGIEAVMMQRNVSGPLEIGHYGFLRKPDAFFKKAKALQGYFFNSYDPRLKAAESHPGNWMEMPGISGWENDLLPFTGTHPKVIHEWLLDRGYKL